MESPTAKRPKMSDHTKDESRQTSSDIQQMEKPDDTYSTYDYHYNNPYYVDKTLLIKALMDINHVLITAPSRFGKSLNMDMVKRFVEIEVDKNGERIELNVDENTRCLTQDQSQSNNFKMFQGKKIYQEKEIMNKHFGKYPTIYVNFRSVQADDYEGVLDRLRIVLYEAFQKHPYLLKSDLWNREGFNKEVFMEYYDDVKVNSLSLRQVEYGLKKLSQYLCEHYGKQVYVFIDEFDVPVNSMVYDNKMKDDDREKVIQLIGLMISNLVKDNVFVERSLSNACHQLGGILLGSANNVKISRFLQDNSFAEFYGFEQTEVRSILEKAGRAEYFDVVKRMYDGYKTKSTDGKDIEIYSPWSILNCIYFKNFENYWAAYIPSKIKSQIGHPKIRLKLKDMLSGYSVKIVSIPKFESIEIQKLIAIVNISELDTSDVDLFVQFLYELGFFRITKKENNDLWLDIPNDSVRNEIDSYIHKYDSVKAFYNHSTESINDLIESVKHVGESRDENSVRDLAKSIEALFKAGTMPVTKEMDVHETLDVYMRQHFLYVANECYTSGDKKCDTILFDKERKVVIVFEWKFGKRSKRISSTAGHKQIFEKGYHTILDKKSLATIFPTDTSDVEQRMYFGVHVAPCYETSITYSFGPNDRPKDVCSSDAKN